MTHLIVEHVTTYRYARPVTFEQHELMCRPQDSHDLRLLQSTLSVAPPASIRWYHDVFNNSIAIFDFAQTAQELRFESRIELELFTLGEEEIFPVADFAQTLPFTYPASELPDLGRTIERHYPDPSDAVGEWARQFLCQDANGIETTCFLECLTQGIRNGFAYAPRDEPGVQTPIETLDLGSGSCRDFALLMMEAARSQGLAARFVTGYLYDPALEGQQAMRGGGTTHAWVQIYLPGAGWAAYDPTNGIVGGQNLIRVGVARDPSQAIPLKGSYVGSPEDFTEMSVAVSVTAA
jgi:transglutaminase-like putative cysteine protease